MKTTNVKFAEYTVTEVLRNVLINFSHAFVVQFSLRMIVQLGRNELHVFYITGVDGKNKYGPNADRDHKCKHKKV